MGKSIGVMIVAKLRSSEATVDVDSIITPGLSHCLLLNVLQLLYPRHTRIIDILETVYNHINFNACELGRNLIYVACKHVHVPATFVPVLFSNLCNSGFQIAFGSPSF